MARGLVIWALAGAVGLTACGEDSQTSTSTGPGTGGSGASGASGGTGNPGGGGEGGTTTTTTTGDGGSGGDDVPAGEVRIIAIGDTGEGNNAQFCVAEAMSQTCTSRGCDAVLMAGDNFYKESDGLIASNGGVENVDDPIWDTAFEQPYDQPGLNGLPFYAVFGNHDYSPPLLQQIIGSDGVMQAQIDYSSLPVGNGPGMRASDKWHMPAQWYDVDIADKGMLHVFAFDTVHAGQLSDTTDQLNDMAGRVSASSATWKLVFAHHPRFTSGQHALDNDFLNGLTALQPPSMFQLQQGIYCNADVFLAGHDHNREYLGAGKDGSCPNTHFLISGAGAKVRESSAPMQSGSQYYNDTIEGYFYLVATATELTIESFDMDPNDCAGAAMATPAWSIVIPR